MGHQAKATKVLENALKRSNATIKKKDPRARHDVFKAWTIAALLETYKDPRAILLEIASTPTAKLAAEMHGTLADALAERRLCAQAVLPYVAQKLPVQVDMRHTRAIVLNIVDDRQYEELVTLDAEQTDDENGFSMQLMTGNADDSSSSANSPPHATQQPAQPQQRALSWDIEPGNKGAQRKNVTSIDAVTPPADTTPTREE